MVPRAQPPTPNDNSRRPLLLSRHAIRRLQPLRYPDSCSGCFRLERLPGGICTHWKAPPFHGARQKRSFRCMTQINELYPRRRLLCRLQQHDVFPARVFHSIKVLIKRIKLLVIYSPRWRGPRKSDPLKLGH